jgi:hypothetical protein
VLIDSAGLLCGVAAVALILYFYRKGKKNGG